MSFKKAAHEAPTKSTKNVTLTDAPVAVVIKTEFQKNVVSENIQYINSTRVTSEPVP